MQFSTFIKNLSIKQIFSILRLWSRDGYNNTYFTQNDYYYLIRIFSKSVVVMEFYNFYKKLPLDVQEERYFDSIISYYIYLN